jgi:hypothetical protein
MERSKQRAIPGAWAQPRPWPSQCPPRLRRLAPASQPTRRWLPPDHNKLVRTSTRNHDGREHRLQLLDQLRTVTGLDPARAIERVEDDIRAIEEGLEQLKPPPGTLPENKWQ